MTTGRINQVALSSDRAQGGSPTTLELYGRPLTTNAAFLPMSRQPIRKTREQATFESGI